MKSLFLICTILCSTLLSYSQNIVTITDPDIEFSLNVPQNWKTHDDGFYYILSAPDKGFNQLSITYFETNETAVDDQFEALTKAAFPIDIPGFKLIETGTEKVNDQPAKWAIYTSTIDGVEMMNIIYMFLSSGQIFNVNGTATKQHFDELLTLFSKTTKSIKTKQL